MIKKRLFLLATILCGISTLSALLSSSTASAYDYREEIVRKGMFQGTLGCMNATGKSAPLPNPLEKSRVSDGVLITTLNRGSTYSLPTNTDNKNAKPFPYAGNDKQNCFGIMYGLQSSSIYSRVLKVDMSEKIKDVNFVTKYMGYTDSKKNASDEGEVCVSFKVDMEWKPDNGGTLQVNGTAKTRNFCLQLSGGKVKDVRIERSTEYEGIDETYGPVSIDIQVENGALKLPKAEDPEQTDSVSLKGLTKDAAIDRLQSSLRKWFNSLINDYWTNNVMYGGKGSRQCSSLAGKAAYSLCTYNADHFSKRGIVITSKGVPDGYSFESFRVIEGTLKTDAVKSNTTSNPNLVLSKDPFAIVKAVTGTTSENQAYISTYLTYSDKIMLYQYYLLGTYGLEVSCKEESKPQDGSGIKFFNEGQTKPDVNCRVIGLDASNKVQNKKVNGVKPVSGLSGYSMSFFAFGGQISLTDVIDFMKSIPEDTVLAYPSDGTSSYYNTDMTDADAVADAEESKKKKNNDASCYDTAGSSNWIACPIIDNSSIATKTLYNYIENMIQVNTELFTTDKSTSGTFAAWESFRNIANVVFIIVFIIVILSQITGFGVDNYGIKKILPKLILGALLVNISFYVCQACIDVANITGGGIKGLLQSAANNIKGSKELQFQFDKMNAVKIGTTISVATIAAAIVAAAIYVSGGAVLVPLLLCAVGVAIGVLFFLILLAVRQGLAVILVVISPMAFVAYMLPNTKTLFSKWLKLFSGTLLAYPICALVLYGGELTSKIMLVAASNPSSGLITNFGLSVTSAILSIAPVFFVPTLITKSMAGISAISGRLQNSLSAMAKGATQRSGLSQGIEEGAKGVKYRRAKTWVGKHRNDEKMGAYKRARMRNRMGAVDAYERESAKMYETQAAGLDMSGLTDMAKSSFKKDGSFDAEKFEAAFAAASVIDPQRVWTDLFKDVSETDEYRNIKDAKDKTSFAKISNTLARHGGVIGKAINKENHANTNPLQSYSALATSAAVGSRISNMSEDIVGQMDKDQFETIGNMITAARAARPGTAFSADQYLSEEQMKQAVGMSMSGGDQTAFQNHIIRNTTAVRAQSVLGGLTDEQWGLADNKNLSAMFAQAGSVTMNGTTYTTYEAYNNAMAARIKAAGNAELIGKLRTDQRAAYTRIP